MTPHPNGWNTISGIIGHVSNFIHHWLTEKRPDSASLLGIPTFWYARAGKVLQLLSGSVIVLDILGIDRIRKGGQRIRDAIDLKSLFPFPGPVMRRLEILILDARIYFLPSPQSEYILMGEGEGKDGRNLGSSYSGRNPHYSADANAALKLKGDLLSSRRDALVSDVPFNYLSYIPGIIVVACSAYPVYIGFDSVPAKWLLWIGSWAPIFFLANMLFVAAIGVIILIPMLLVDVLILEPAGRLLLQERLREISLTVSFSLLVVGALIDIALS